MMSVHLCPQSADGPEGEPDPGTVHSDSPTAWEVLCTIPVLLANVMLSCRDREREKNFCYIHQALDSTCRDLFEGSLR